MIGGSCNYLLISIGRKIIFLQVAVELFIDMRVCQCHVQVHSNLCEFLLEANSAQPGQDHLVRDVPLDPPEHATQAVSVSVCDPDTSLTELWLGSFVPSGTNLSSCPKTWSV